MSLLAVGLSACGPAPRQNNIDDPYEAQNRQMHKLNIALDRALVKPASQAYGKVTPDPLRRGISNFASNLSLPGVVMNDLLQLKLGAAMQNTARFAFNSTVGLAGVFDVASMNKLPERPNDFGQTLYVWGFKEGPYIELPLFGGSTERGAIGLAVDFAANPTSVLLAKNQRRVGTVAKVLKKAGDRYKYSDLVDSVLYDSVDSYAQNRLLYLQSRRRDLYGSISESDLEDPYAN